MIAAAGSVRNRAAGISQSLNDLSHRTESQAARLENTAAALDELTASAKSAAEGARSVEAAATGIEATRAGEARRGFAVLASEVRALAERSLSAAMEIKALIGNSSKQVVRGASLVSRTGEALTSITARVSHISRLVSGNAEAAAEQSAGLSEINTGVTQFDQVTQQNAAMVEQATAAGHMLNADAAKLAGLAAHFKISGGAAVPARVTRAEAPAPATLTAHGDRDETGQQPVAAAADGNSVKVIWREF